VRIFRTRKEIDHPAHRSFLFLAAALAIEMSCDFSACRPSTGYPTVRQRRPPHRFTGLGVAAKTDQWWLVSLLFSKSLSSNKEWH